MQLYKYKSLSNFEFVADILLNKRLFASDFNNLNDPMEGDFNRDYTSSEYSKIITDEMRKIKICSLSSNMNNPILWAHYADGFKGICIEVEIDESILTPHKITYSGFNPIPSEEDRGLYGIDEKMTPSDWAIVALKSKNEAWQYEDEYRLFSDAKHISKGLTITAIYFGTRMSEVYKGLIHKLLSGEIEKKETIILDSNMVIPVIEFRIN